MQSNIRCAAMWMCLVLILGCTLSANAAIDANTIAGLWLFDENSGTVAKDMSGNGNDGELMGNASWAAGVYGSGVEFDGAVGSIVSIPDSASLQMSDAFTIMLWLRTGKKMVEMFGDRQIVIGKHYTEYELGIYTEGQIHTYTWGRPDADGYDEGILASIGGQLPGGEADWEIDKWFHVAWTLDGDHMYFRWSPVNTITANCDGPYGAVFRGESGAPITEAHFEFDRSRPFLRMSCCDAAGRWAWTNPVWTKDLS